MRIVLLIILTIFNGIALAKPISNGLGLASTGLEGPQREDRSELAFNAVRQNQQFRHLPKHNRISRKFTRKNAHHAMQLRLDTLEKELEYQTHEFQDQFDVALSQ